jgi:cytochrome c553
LLKAVIPALVLIAGLASSAPARAVDAGPPPWAFAMDPPETAQLKPGPADNVPRRAPNSAVSFTRAQLLDLFNAADWHPNDHPPAPEVVMHGRKPGVFACAYCHYPNGAGLAENAALAGLPADYIVQQFRDFKTGARSSALPHMVSFESMPRFAAAITLADLKAAADYFASLKMRPWIKVIETDTVPKTRSIGYTLRPDPGGGTEPLGYRIVETPANPALYDLHDSESGFIAYVPRGSIAKGRALATTGGGGKTQPCESCHGPGLKGMDATPPLAGRGTSNFTRQLYNFREGARGGAMAQPMQSVVAYLTEADMVDLAAYVASLKP